MNTTNEKNSFIKTTQLVINFYKKQYGQIARNTTFQERKYILDFIEEEEKEIERVKKLPNTATRSEIWNIDEVTFGMLDKVVSFIE